MTPEFVISSQNSSERNPSDLLAFYLSCFSLLLLIDNLGIRKGESDLILTGRNNSCQLLNEGNTISGHRMANLSSKSLKLYLVTVSIFSGFLLLGSLIGRE